MLMTSASQTTQIIPRPRHIYSVGMTLTPIKIVIHYGFTFDLLYSSI